MKFFLVLASTIMLAACGGGDELTRDGSGNTPDDPDQSPDVSYAVTLTIADADGTATNEVSEGNPLVVTATVTATGGAAVNDILVTFTMSSTGLANFDNDSSTALTNADGVAQIGLEVGQLRGDALVTGSIEIGSNTTSANVGFSSTGTQQTQVVPATLELFSSQVQMESSGSDSVILTAVVKNEQNVLLEGVDVSFSADNGASLSVDDNGVSNASGIVTATLTTANNQMNRTINVSASTASLTDDLTLEVVGTEVRVNGASSAIINDSVPLTVNLIDSEGNGISGQTVQLSVSSGSLDNNSPLTGANGQVLVNFTANVSGVSTITASALNAEGSFEVTVQQDDFTFSSLPSDDIPLNTAQDISVRWFKDNAAFVGGDVVVTTSRGDIATPNIVTNNAGIATFSISSAFAGPASISAIGTDNNGNQVTARANVEFIASQVQSIFVDATPDLIGPEGETSTITAVVRDPSGNLVKGKVVDFSLLDSSGGSISPNSATTGSDGIASTVYTSNAVSAEDGVTVTASADGVSSSVDLTVGDRAFDISIGTGAEIESPDSSTYLKEFAVFVSDSVGRPVENAELTASSTPVKFSSGGTYQKGFYQYDADSDRWVRFITATCDNEDINNNGRLDAGEDVNGDGELTPGIIGTISFQDGISRTNASGQATLELRYPRQFALWAEVEIAVFGQSSGSEARDSQTLTLPIEANDINDENKAPPANPFGSAFDCSDPN
ncbi:MULTISPECIES: Ig-like domain-containing protein [Alteromonadaceae]|uniref:Ig-like domain-containing protein n=1 Tax=Brumicola blandensis TaxID=3075611 RepID=A0AAW8QZE3_9ALTE|nr:MULTISPECIES: Ig-like domain-containing protein [unclassified Alteromonas]MDT0581346.1 Ig-like domain-containing protein [Alteromonas sp. W409]MDT0626974.1 Ig-like domain-containing protein [Alteromonas sp. W364]